MQLIHQALVIVSSVILIFVQSGFAISCYDCNSHDNPDCALDVPPETLIKDCSILGTKYKMCRKIKQNIEFEVNNLPPDSRIIRGCGWDDSNYNGRCYQRSGFGGRQEVCSCLTDLCNAAERTHQTSFAVLGVCSFVLYNIYSRFVATAV